MDEKILLLLAPLLLIDLAGRAAALWSLWNASATRGPKGLWVAIVLLVSGGWIAWFLLGRREG